MNNDRRHRVASALARLNDIDAELSEVLSEEEEAYENLPDSLKFGQAAGEMEDAVEKLQEACGNIEEAIGALSEFSK